MPHPGLPVPQQAGAQHRQKLVAVNNVLRVLRSAERLEALLMMARPTIRPAKGGFEG